MSKVDWNAKNYEVPVSLSLKEICKMITDETTEVQIEFIEEVLAYDSTGKVFESVQELMKQ